MLPCAKAISHGKHIQTVSFLSLKPYNFRLLSLQISPKLTINTRPMSGDYDVDDNDYPTSVAAAAYAVWSLLDDSKAKDQIAKAYGPRMPLNKPRRKSQKKAEIPPQQPHKYALKFSDKTSKQSLKDPYDVKIPDTDETSSNHPSLGMPLTFPDKQTNVDDRESLETPPPIPYGRHTPQQFETPSTTKPGPRDSMADAWENEEMASIRERYERLRGTIDQWEMKKKKKANLKLEKMQGNNRKESNVSRSHRNEVQRIEEIAGEARAQAERKRIKEEFKVKEKANKIRSTGKLPTTCLCF